MGPPGAPGAEPRVVQNPPIPMPSNQPSGVPMPGPQRAVQPNIGLSNPANLPLSTNKTREDGTPSLRVCVKGDDPAVKRKAQKQIEACQERERGNSEVLKKRNLELDGKQALLHNVKSL